MKYQEKRLKILIVLFCTAGYINIDGMKETYNDLKRSFGNLSFGNLKSYLRNLKSKSSSESNNKKEEDLSKVEDPDRNGYDFDTKVQEEKKDINNVKNTEEKDIPMEEIIKNAEQQHNPNRNGCNFGTEAKKEDGDAKTKFKYIPLDNSITKVIEGENDYITASYNDGHGKEYKVEEGYLPEAEKVENKADCDAEFQEQEDINKVKNTEEKGIKVHDIIEEAKQEEHISKTHEFSINLRKELIEKNRNEMLDLIRLLSMNKKNSNL